MSRRGRGRDRRRGYTLVEVTVFSSVGLLVLAGLWSIFHSSMRRGKVTETKVEGLQSVLLFAKVFEDDMAHLYERAMPGTANTLKPYSIFTALAAGKGSVFEFYRHHPDPARGPGGRWGDLVLQKITYRYDAARRKIFRAVDGGPERPLFGLFETLKFRPANWPGMTPPKAGELGPAPGVVYCVASTPRDLLKMTLAERDAKRPRARTSLMGVLGREDIAKALAYPEWNRVPYLPPVVAAGP